MQCVRTKTAKQSAISQNNMVFQDVFWLVSILCLPSRQCVSGVLRQSVESYSGASAFEFNELPFLEKCFLILKIYILLCQHIFCRNDVALL